MAQSVESTFFNNNSPQSLKLISKADKYDAYIDQNRKIANSDGSVTVETIYDYREPLADGTKSIAQTNKYYCNEKDEKKYLSIDLTYYSGSKKTGTVLKDRKITSTIYVAKQNTVAENLYNAACSPTQSQTLQTAVVTGNQKSFKLLSQLTPQDIYLSVVKKGMTDNDLNILLAMYGFIWDFNIFLSMEPQGNTAGDQLQKKQYQELVQYKSQAQITLRKFEETLSTLAANVGLSNAQFKQAIGIVEFSGPPFEGGSPNFRTLMTKKGGGYSSTILNRDDITFDAINEGFKFSNAYKFKPGIELTKKDGNHPLTELSPSVFFDYYSNWIPAYYLAPSRLSKLNTAAVSREEGLEKYRAEQAQSLIKQQEEERKKQVFLSSPEGKRQIAKEQAEEALRQKQFAKEYPYYAVITCGVHFPVHACFAGQVQTELELRNGNDYKMYTLVDIMQIRQDQTGISFDLRNKFEIKMQNSRDNLILNLKVYNRTSNSIVYEKSAARFGVIRFSN